ncbi:hypothetical protein DM01DRAFT_1047017 [Hesseltinella vesiculosa]|uniref:Uncharacterized protein n=1 Tax=Hesseltinella vesiculosa TaxID=101127 RepID=A0A1X2GGX7_9FUNG|nr:hypothetical protein DM01DRAFT_1047017 [Hesseltinella vesiculosa]
MNVFLFVILSLKSLPFIFQAEYYFIMASHWRVVLYSESLLCHDNLRGDENLRAMRTCDANTVKSANPWPISNQDFDMVAQV